MKAWAGPADRHMAGVEFDSISATWDRRGICNQPATSTTCTFVAKGTSGLVPRAACYIVGRFFRWRPAADREALANLSAASDPVPDVAWGLPRLQWREPSWSLVGICAWERGTVGVVQAMRPTRWGRKVGTGRVNRLTIRAHWCDSGPPVFPRLLAGEVAPDGAVPIWTQVVSSSCVVSFYSCGGYPSTQRPSHRLRGGLCHTFDADCRTYSYTMFMQESRQAAIS